MRSRQPANELTIFEDHQCRNSLNTELSSQAVILFTCINVHLCEGQSSLVLMTQTLENGSNSAARTAPCGPEINDHRNIGLDHLLLKVGRIDMEQVGLGIHSVFSTNFLYLSLYLCSRSQMLLCKTTRRPGFLF